MDQTNYQTSDFRDNFLYFRNPLRVKANSGSAPYPLFPWFLFWTAQRNRLSFKRVAYPQEKDSNTEETARYKEGAGQETSVQHHSWHKRTIFPLKSACSIYSLAFAASRSGSRDATRG
jgi:hypothetical protein